MPLISPLMPVPPQAEYDAEECTSVEQSAYHTDFTVITANVQAAAEDIPVRAVVFVTFLLHCLRHDFLR